MPHCHVEGRRRHSGHCLESRRRLEAVAVTMEAAVGDLVLYRRHLQDLAVVVAREAVIVVSPLLSLPSFPPLRAPPPLDLRTRSGEEGDDGGGGGHGGRMGRWSAGVY